MSIVDKDKGHRLQIVNHRGLLKYSRKGCIYKNPKAGENTVPFESKYNDIKVAAVPCMNEI